MLKAFLQKKGHVKAVEADPENLISPCENGLSDSHGVTRMSPIPTRIPVAEDGIIQHRFSQENPIQGLDVHTNRCIWLGAELERQSNPETISRRSSRARRNLSQRDQGHPIVSAALAQANSATSIDCLGSLANAAACKTPSDSAFLDMDSLPIEGSMGTQQEIWNETHAFDNFNAGAEDMILTDDFQTWFSQLNSSSLSQTYVDHSGFLISSPGVPLERASKRLRSISLGSSGFSGGDVPDDRFPQVQKFWIHNSGNHRRVIHSLWKDLSLVSSDNILARKEYLHGSNFPQALPTPQSQSHSRRGLEKSCGERLEKMFNKVHCANTRSPSTFQKSPDEMLRSPPPDIYETPIPGLKFPPVEILDMALDLYFRHFHPLLPFIHVPTFDPKVFDEPTLFTMCLIGLTLINTHGAKVFVQQAFDVVMDIVETQMSAHARDSHLLSHTYVRTVACGMLLICLAEILGERADQPRSQRLYVQLLTQAQEQGLFAAENGEKLDENLLSSFEVTESRWKAWCRIESTKRQVKTQFYMKGCVHRAGSNTPRLIVTLLLVDSWFATVQTACPLIRTDHMQWLLPCSAALFEAKSAEKWLELQRKSHLLFMPVMKLSTMRVDIPRTARPMDMLGMHGLLSTIRIRISDDYYRLLSESGSDKSFVPWETFATDLRGNITRLLVVEVLESYGDMMGLNNPNCMAMWHSTCIMLTADIRLFERGAGCAGTILAREAFSNIAIWTQTTGARRAILHAAQMYKIMSDRRASDGDPFHASNGLFTSALILSLYVLMVPAESITSTTPPFELLDTVDWRIVGREGLSHEFEYNGHAEDPGVGFIRHGGPISLSGAVHSSGYQSARRILLQFVHLLDDIGKFRVERYTRILRILSSTLIDDADAVDN
ncbi:hypothetical protein BKA64DRAFT_725677 [Cadophora sp. MPI-SDFR-AT-0126]|nr:hypothetical protein BKA64DRAFT_725677 [Leotiomycetes sp. MPI-SDFR-AT-0126]